jgi:drug/metabolite transporter (DMT)-like permease
VDVKDVEPPRAESPGRHDLAIGYYIGALILFLGVVLVFTGLLGPERPAERRLGFDINLWWGLAMTAFGAVALLLNYLTRRHRARRS